MARPKAKSVLATVVFVAIVAFAAGWWLANRTGSATSPDGDVTGRDALPTTQDPLRTTVEEIVDGDTVYLSDLDERMRLIGIDTPETRHPNRGVECYGKEASAHLEELVPPGTEVLVEWDVEPTDDFGRPLGYLYRAGDGLFVNEAMALDGYALVSTVPPNVARQDLFVAAAREAREADRGLWSECEEYIGSGGVSEGDGPVVIFALLPDAPGSDLEPGNSENVTLENTGDEPVDVGDWTVTDESGTTIMIPDGYSIAPGAKLTVYSGPGDDSAAAYFAGLGQALWNNSGDTATLADADGTVVATYTYD